MLTDTQVLSLISEIEGAAFDLGLKLEALAANSTFPAAPHLSWIRSLAKSLRSEEARIQERSALFRMAQVVKPQLRVVS